MGSLASRIKRLISGERANSLFGVLGSRDIGNQYAMMDDNPKDYIDKALVYNPDAASIINYITDVAVRVPWYLYNGDKVVENHKIYDIWNEGNPVVSGSLLRAQFIQHYLTTGNAYLYGVTPEAGENASRFLEFWNLPVDMKIKKGPPDNPIAGYLKEDHSGQRQEIDPGKVIHWKMPNPEGDGYYGTSPLKAARLVLQQSNDSYIANAKSLQNLGARGILTRRDQTHAGPEKAMKLKEAWKRENAGADKWNKLTITDGEYDYINFGLSPVDLQILEAQHRSRQVLCSIYKFPSELLNDKDASTYNNLNLMLRKLYMDMVIPLLENMAELLNNKWVSQWGDNLSFRPDWSGVEALDKNKEEQARWLAAAWWIPVERKAEIMGEQTTLTGYYIPSGLFPEGDGEINTDDALKQYMESV